MLSPGVHLKLPVIDIVHVQSVRQRAQYIRGQTVITKDAKSLCVGSSLYFEVVDIERLHRSIHNAHDTIEQMVQAAICEYVSNVNLIEFSRASLQLFVARELFLDRYGLRFILFAVNEIAIVRTFRIADGAIGSFTGYDQRLEVGEVLRS